MKVFISYGHRDHTKVVDKLFDALKKEGLEPWKDDRYEGESGIPAGEDFTKHIYQVIDECDLVIAFVTEITKQRKYCCDERNYAYDHKDTRFIQIRMDHTTMTMGNSRSYVDMSDVEEADGKVNDALFRKGLEAILSAMRDPQSFANGGLIPWAKFEAHLRVQAALGLDDPVMLRCEEDFVGREWLAEKCKSWVYSGEDSPRLFVIYGEAGSGKTAFVNHLASDSELVRSVHICVYDRPATRSAKNTIKDLAFVLAKHNDRYYERLKFKDFGKIDELTEDGLFDFLFVEPLKDETEKYLLVIDALDEMDKENGFETLVKLFRQFMPRLNRNIAFLVTCRPEDNIKGKLGTVSDKELPAICLDKETNLNDIDRYIRKTLTELSCFSDALATKLLQACDGNFEYLSLLFKEVREEGLELSESISLPKGLANRYTQYLDRRLDKKDYRFSREQRLLLSLLCSSYEPMPLSLLAEISDYDEYDAEDELTAIGSLVRMTESNDGEIYVSLFTKGFRDYLVSGKVRKYSVNVSSGIKTTAEFILNSCKTGKALSRYPYLEKYGYTYLLLYYEKAPEEVQRYIAARIKEGHDKAIDHLADALCSGGDTAIDAFFCMKETIDRYDDVVSFIRNRRNKTVLLQIADKYKEKGIEDDHCCLLADIELLEPSPEAYSKAITLYSKAIELNKQSYDEDPSFKNRRELSISYSRLADVYSQQRTEEALQKAESLYKQAVEINERNYRETPCYESRSNLASAYHNLAFTVYNHRMESSLLNSEKLLRKALELEERNYRDDPCFDSRNSLSASYNQLAGVLIDQHTDSSLQEAEKLYQKAVELSEQNYRENPCYVSKNTLSLYVNNFALLFFERRTKESSIKAEKLCRKVIELCEQNYHDTPCYESRQTLSNLYYNLAAMLSEQKAETALSEAEKLFRKAIELGEYNYQENPCYECRSNLAATYHNYACLLGDQKTKKALSDAEELFRKVIELGEYYFKENPCFESRQNLADSYYGLAVLLDEEKSKKTQSDAEKLYRKAIELREYNYQAKPNHEIRDSLTDTYTHLAFLLFKQKTKTALLEAAKLFRHAIELSEYDYKEKPCLKTKKSLAITYHNLAANLFTLKNKTSLIESEQLFIRSHKMLEELWQKNKDGEVKRALIVSYTILISIAEKKKDMTSHANVQKWKSRLAELLSE